MAATIEQIAEAAGVSRGTVDRVLHNRGRVNQEVADRVWKIADELDYVPKRRKQNKPGQKTKIGIVTQLAKASFMTEVNRGIKDAGNELEDRGVELIIREIISIDEAEQLQAVDDLVLQGIQGLAIMPAGCAAVRIKLNHLIEERNIPVVTFNSDIIGTGRICFVGLDNRKSGSVAAGLMGMLTGSKGKILIITGYFSNNVNNTRVDGFLEEIKKTFPELEPVGVQGSFDDADEVEKIIINTMTAYPDLAGILVVSGGQAGIVSAFESLGLKKRPYVIAYDLTPENVKLLNDNRIDFLIDQEGYVQGYRPPGILADLIQKGKKPEAEFLYTDINIKTKYNI